MGRAVHIALCLLLLAPSLCAQHQHDPLSDAEIDQLRDAALDPPTRLKLYVDFARARLDAIDKARNDPKAADRAGVTHDKLQEFLDIYDEMDDNIDNFDKRGDDLRNPLKAIIQADNEFQAKLRALHEGAMAAPAEASPYQFLLSDALDDVDAATKDHRDLLAEQEDAVKHKKKAMSPAVPEEPR